MKLIYLHGPPAVGKFTIAKELENLAGCKLFHNHLTIDVVRPLFEFGSENFWGLVQKLRLICFEAVAKHDAGNIIYTSCYDHPGDLPFIESIEAVLSSVGGEFIPVFLQCDFADLEKRVTGSSRVEMGKIISVEGLRKQLSKWNCTAVPRDNCITIETTGKSPIQCAEEIIKILELNR